MAFVFKGALQPVVAYILMRKIINEYRRKAKLLFAGDDEMMVLRNEIKAHLNPISTYVT